MHDCRRDGNARADGRDVSWCRINPRFTSGRVLVQIIMRTLAASDRARPRVRVRRQIMDLSRLFVVVVVAVVACAVGGEFFLKTFLFFFLILFIILKIVQTYVQGVYLICLYTNVQS